VPVYAALDPGVMAAGVGDSYWFQAGDLDEVLEVVERYDVLVVGPGLGPVDGEFVEGLLASWNGPLVLDADGINALDGVATLTSRMAPIVITPHAGEFVRISGEDASYQAAERLADKTGALVLLKGSPTFVTDGAETWAVTTGGSELDDRDRRRPRRHAWRLHRWRITRGRGGTVGGLSSRHRRLAPGKAWHGDGDRSGRRGRAAIGHGHNKAIASPPGDQAPSLRLIDEEKR
jgi:hypothetical protein